jgi:enoyl-CoA hydratase/carnithine racemase
VHDDALCGHLATSFAAAGCRCALCRYTHKQYRVSPLQETKLVFDAAGSDPECRVVLFSGNGKMFTSGIDLAESFVAPMRGDDKANSSTEPKERPDFARVALSQLEGISQTQALFNAIEECRVPVIACVHRACLGAGVDMICAADIRYCTADSIFSSKS